MPFPGLAGAKKKRIAFNAALEVPISLVIERIRCDLARRWCRQALLSANYSRDPNQPRRETDTAIAPARIVEHDAPARGSDRSK